MSTDVNRVGAPSLAWRNAIAALQTFQAARGNADVPRRFRVHGVDLGAWVSTCRDRYWDGLLSAVQISDMQSVPGWEWGPARPGTWREAFNDLARYAARHGSTLAPADDTVRQWAAAQRKIHAIGELADTRAAQLETLPHWEWDLDQLRWHDGIEAARQYVQIHGTIRSATPGTCVGGFGLGWWLQRCRQDHRAGTLPAPRATELEGLPGWSWGRAEHNWDRGMAALAGYIAKTGNARPSQHVVINGVALGVWVCDKRRRYRLGMLPPGQAAALQALPGWQWSPQEANWQRGLDALTQYVDRHGGACPSSACRVGAYPVGEWVRAQREAYRHGRLPIQRAALLQDIPGWCWHHQDCPAATCCAT
ncbi:helicase associated domain-containing protein [Mycobacteroides abscessus]|uniref:helicase associated domain-containing protein n=1 Tax=Mycobacteroides abscessus TaxID=36809 RepID=UPI0009A6F07E|nr:helicase associated domain-containing protein [Mycobacteroides abscessus]RIT41618.1 helicase [Mycobacteroides abscessus]SKT96780.1 Putative helicase [Mycobacteroides abscessus subsp. massiliense]SKU11467.1 Putative helicase [Mycobacteroides abscessus subsp. massiliense]